jgi:hypothetical protein
MTNHPISFEGDQQLSKKFWGWLNHLKKLVWGQLTPISLEREIDHPLKPLREGGPVTFQGLWGLSTTFLE